MAEPKTAKTGASVTSFVNAVDNPQRRKDLKAVMKMMREIIGSRPVMWGTSIIGYGSYDMVYANGKTGRWMVTGLAPRKQNLTLYIMSGFKGYQTLLGRLGKHKTGKSCLYINTLEDVDPDVLHQLISESVTYFRDRPPARHP